MNTSATPADAAPLGYVPSAGAGRARRDARGVDGRVHPAWSRVLGSLADLACVLGADALDAAELLGGGLGDLLEGAEAHAVQWFESNLYVKPKGDPPPNGPDDLYLGVCPTPTNYCPLTARPSLSTTYRGAGLLPGQRATLTFTTILTTGGLQWLYAQADTYWGDPGTTVYGSPDHARFTEANETNNIFGPIGVSLACKVYLPLILK